MTKANNDKPTVLIVDDVTENLHAIINILRDKYAVIAATNGPKALELAASTPQPELILLDIKMPEMDGYETCRRIKKTEHGGRIPIIFLSVIDKPVEKVRGFSLGAADYIAKPFDIDEARARIRTHLELSRLRLSLEEQVAERTAALSDTMSRLQATLDAIPDLLFEVDAQGRYLEVHAPRHELLAASPEDLVGKLMSDVLPPDAGAVCMAALHEAKEKGWSSGKQFALPVPQGQSWFELSVSRKSSAAAPESRFIVLSRDITARKRAEEEISAGTEQWEHTFNAISEIVMILDPGFRIVDANQASCRMFHATLEELQGELCHQLFEERLEPCDGCPIPQAVQKVESQTTEIVYQKMGKIFWVSVSPLVDSHGEVIRVVLFAKDITEQKALSTQLLQAQKMEALGTLTGGVAHDFNNVLTIVLGYLHLAMAELQPEMPVYQALQEVKKAALRAAGIVKQLLLFSRRQPMETSTLNLNNSVENLLKMLHRFIGEDITLATNLATDLWNIKGDMTSLDQLIMNLTVNARDAMPQGGKIMIKTENLCLDDEFCQINTKARPGNFIRLSITDTGTGMDQATLQRIFEPFFTTKEAGKGTGLGLAVTYGVVKEHQGWITVDSVPGQGTTFRMYLPAVPEEASAALGACRT